MTDLIFREFLATVNAQQLVTKKPRQFQKWLSKCTCELFWKYSKQFCYHKKSGEFLFFVNTSWQDIAYVHKYDVKIACALSDWLQQIEINWRAHISWSVWSLTTIQKENLLSSLHQIKNKTTDKSRFGWWRATTMIQNLESLTLRDLLQFYELLPVNFKNLHLLFSSRWTDSDFRLFWLKTIAVRNQTAHLRNVYNWKYRISRSEGESQTFWLLDYLKLSLGCKTKFNNSPLKNANFFLKKISKRVLICKFRSLKEFDKHFFALRVKKEFTNLKIPAETEITSPLGHL